MAGGRVPSPPSLSCRTSPPQGGRSAVCPSRQFCNVENRRSRCWQPISPLEGEMSGRTERGAWARHLL
ncbi:hypothetical protein FJ987_11505 [Mesorhizobium sp. CU2]|nr:hypothetical protein FJ988_23990 [Mesorhizobium sp. CU3]TPO15969.1 hypothetical protein FJ987_11505 [Mesorhizobium sp. CU2]